MPGSIKWNGTPSSVAPVFSPVCLRVFAPVFSRVPSSIAPLILASVFALVVVWAGAGAAQNVELSVHSMPHWGNPDWVRAVADEYEARNPHVSITVTPGWVSQIVTMTAGGVSPDIIHYDSANFHQFVKLGFVSPLDSFISADTDFDPSAFLPAMYDLFKHQGRQMALPQNGFVVGMNYNVDLLNARGVAPPDGTWEWSDLLEAARKITHDVNGNGDAEFFGFSDSYGHHNRWPVWVWGAGGTLWNEGMTRTLVNSEAALTGIEFMYDLYFTHRVGPRMVGGAIIEPDAPSTRSGDAAYEELWAEGRVGLFYGFRTGPGNFELGVAPIAKGPSGSQETILVTNFFAIPEASTKKDEAWKFLKFLTSEESHRIAASLSPQPDASTHPIPAVRELAADVMTRTKADRAWLNIVPHGRINPIIHPVLEGDDLRALGRGLREGVARGEVPLRQWVHESARLVNNQLQQLIRDGVTW